VGDMAGREHRHRHRNGWPGERAVDAIVAGQNLRARMANVMGSVRNLMAVTPER